MTRALRPLATALAGALLAAGCGQAGTPVSSASAGPSPQAPAAASERPTAAPAPNGGGASTPARTPAPPSRSTPTAVPTATGLPEILSFTDATPTCTKTSGEATVKLTWTSRNATEAWISTPIVASAAGDPRTTPGASGPLLPNGSTTLPFDCANQYDYYDLGVYGDGQSAREILQVARNV